MSNKRSNTYRGHRPSCVNDYQERERLSMLAPGVIRPGGWIRETAALELAGFLATFEERDPFNFKTSFYDGSPTVHGGEHAGYWNDSFIGLALLTGDPEALARASERIELTLKAASSRKHFRSPHYNGWGGHLMIHGLMTWYEARGDRRVLDLCHRVALELKEDLDSQTGTAFAGDHPVNMASSCARLYSYTGDQRMLEMGAEIMRRFDANNLPNLKRLLHDDVLRGHCVNYCEDIRHPADFFLASGKPEHLQASLRGVQLTERDHLQAHGVPTGNEPVYGKGPFKETEHCDAVEWANVGHALLAATGEAIHADRTERALFNSWAGSRKWDGTTLAYNHAPNQLTASSWEGTWLPRMNYSHRHEPQCCNLNSHRALHPYAFRLWMLEHEKALTAVYYGACSLSVELPGCGLVEIVEETDYPFSDTIHITIRPKRPAAFPLRFRIPGWCHEASICVNGKFLDGPFQSGSFVLVDRTWKPGDRVEIRLPMPITIQYAETFPEPAKYDPNHLEADKSVMTQIGLRVIEKPQAFRHLAAISRGPLVYSLYIRPQRNVVSVDPSDPHFIIEDVVPAKDSPPWNVALILNPEAPEKSFVPVRLPVSGNAAPFQYPPVGLRGKGLLIPAWKPAGKGEKITASLPEFPFKMEGDPRDILMVPFGCTQIRQTWLPFVFDKPE